MSQPVREFMTSMPHTVGFDIEVGKAQEMMKEYSCHHLPVLKGGKLIGILSDKDLQTIDRVNGKENLKVEDVMTREPITVSSQEDVFQVAMKMYQEKIGSVVVAASEEHPWGIFTATDALGYFSNRSK